MVLIWIEMGIEYKANDHQHGTQFLIVAISQVLYIFFEFFWDEVQLNFDFC